MIRLFVFFGGLIAFALSCLLIVPFFIDWNQFRDRFEYQAKQAIGQSVQVRGHTTARLLPLPLIEFSDVIIGNKNEPIATIQQFQLNMELAPLLRGKIEIANMELLRPKIHLHINKDGHFNFAKSQKLNIYNFGEQISFENIFIKNGRLDISDKRFEKQTTLEHIDISAFADSLNGPWRLQGMLSHNNNRYFTRIDTGRFKNENNTKEKNLAFNLHIAPQFLAYNLDLNGTIIFGENVPRFSGNFFARPTNEANNNFKASIGGNVDVSPFGALVNEYEIKIGDLSNPYIIDGSAFANFNQNANFQIIANGQQLNIQQQQTLDSYALPLQFLTNSLQFFSHLPSKGQIMLNLPTLVYENNLISDIILQAESSQNENTWQIQNFQAKLQGQTTISANGNIQWDGIDLTSARYMGEILFATHQPALFSNWFGVAIDNSIHKAGLQAQAVFSANEIIFNQLELVLGNSTLHGFFQYNGGQTNINLFSQNAEFSHLLVLYDGTKKYGNGNLSLEMNFDKLKIDDEVAHNLQARLNFFNNIWNIKQLRFSNWGGIDLTMGGEINSFENIENINGNLSGQIRIAEHKFLQNKIMQHWGSFAFLDNFLKRNINISPLAMDFTFSNNENSLWQFIGNGTLADSIFQTNITQTQNNNIRSNIKIENENSLNLLKQLGFSVFDILENKNKGLLNLTLTNNEKNNFDISLNLSLGTMMGAGQGKIEFLQNNEKIISPKGQLNFQSKLLDIDRLLFSLGIKTNELPLWDDKNNGSLSGTLHFNNNDFQVTNTQGEINGFTFNTNLDFNIKQNNSCCEIAGNLHIDNVLLSFFPLQFFPTLVAMQQSTIADFIGSIDFSIGVVDIGGEKIENVKTNLKLAHENIIFEKLSGNLYGGNLHDENLHAEIFLANIDLQTSINGSLSLENAKASNLFGLFNLQHLGEAEISTMFDFETSGNDSTTFLQNLNLHGQTSLANGTINNINKNSFINFLEKFVNTTEIKKEDLSDFFIGQYNFTKLPLDIFISQGLIKAELNLIDPLLSILTSAKYNLLENNFIADVDFILASPKYEIFASKPEFSLHYTKQGENITSNFDLQNLMLYLELQANAKQQRAFTTQRDLILQKQRLKKRLENLQQQ